MTDKTILPLDRFHELKTQPPFFESVLRGDKRFELRKNDRNFSTGDTVLLREWNPIGAEYTGRELRGTISYLLEAYPGLAEGYCILGFAPIQQLKDEPQVSAESAGTREYLYAAMCRIKNAYNLIGTPCIVELTERDGHWCMIVEPHVDAPPPCEGTKQADDPPRIDLWDDESHTARLRGPANDEPSDEAIAEIAARRDWNSDMALAFVDGYRAALRG